jgi:DNA-binding transcriptional LysR family regulator
MFPVWERVINTSNVGLSFRPCNIVIDVDTDSLRWFQLVADGMTVTEVAQTYAVSQPGVSRALARLEEQVGTPLLRRSGRLLRLTQAGAAFKRHVDSLVNDLDDGLAAVEQVLDPETGLVSLGFPMSLGTWFVPNVIRDFARVRPRARFCAAAHLGWRARRTVEAACRRGYRPGDHDLARLPCRFGVAPGRHRATAALCRPGSPSRGVHVG